MRTEQKTTRGSHAGQEFITSSQASPREAKSLHCRDSQQGEDKIRYHALSQQPTPRRLTVQKKFKQLGKRIQEPLGLSLRALPCVLLRQTARVGDSSTRYLTATAVEQGQGGRPRIQALQAEEPTQ